MKLFFIPVLLLTLTACSSNKSAKKSVEQKAANETTVSAQNLGTTIDDLIKSSTTLTEQQKTELYGIIASNKKRAEELSAESYKFRAVLVKELLSSKSPNKKEIRILKSSIKKIEGDRLKNTFDTVEKISSIVSKSPENEKFSESLRNIHLERIIR